MPHLLTFLVSHLYSFTDFSAVLLLSYRYDTLKKYIYQLEKQQHEARLAAQARHDDPEAADETSALVASDMVQTGGTDTDAVFRPLLDTELRKISSFYTAQEKELLQELQELEELVDSVDRDGLEGGLNMYDDADGDADEDDDEDDEDEWNDSPVRERSGGRAISTETTGSRRGSSKRRRRAGSSAGKEPSKLLVLLDF